jgi:hypothetical protein
MFWWEMDGREGIVGLGHRMRFSMDEKMDWWI